MSSGEAQNLTRSPEPADIAASSGETYLPLWFPESVLPQQVLARITQACDKLRGHPKLLVF
jgi:hypothetical protein